MEVAWCGPKRSLSESQEESEGRYAADRSGGQGEGCEDGGKAASSGLPEPEWKGEERGILPLEPPEVTQKRAWGLWQRLDPSTLLSFQKWDTGDGGTQGCPDCARPQKLPAACFQNNGPPGGVLDQVRQGWGSTLYFPARAGLPESINLPVSLQFMGSQETPGTDLSYITDSRCPRNVCQQITCALPLRNKPSIPGAFSFPLTSVLQRWTEVSSLGNPIQLTAGPEGPAPKAGNSTQLST